MTEHTHTTNMKDGTISWEVALEREMEYRKRMKNKSPQHSVDSMGLPSGSRSQSQGQLQEANAMGLKRGATSGSSPHPARKVFECSMVHPQPIKGQANPSRKLFAQRATSQQRQDHLGSPQFLNKKRPPQQSMNHQPPLQYRQSLPCHPQPQVQSLRPRPGELLDQRPPRKIETTRWCSLCNVTCMTSLHLELHHQGRKHKANLERVTGKDKKNKEVWCRECNVECANEFSWNQHRVGLKHLARVGKKAMEASDGAGPVIQAKKVGCVKESQRAPCTEEQAKVDMGLPDNRFMSSAVHHQKLRTSNWPNCI